MDLEANSPTDINFKNKFEEKLLEYDQEHQGSQRKPWTRERIIEVKNLLKSARVTIHSAARKSPMDYYWISKYDLMTTAKEEYLIFKRKTTEDPTVRIMPREEYFSILKVIHKICGHGGRDKMLLNIKTRFYIPKKAIEIFVSLCPTCSTKRNIPKKGIVPGPIASQNFNLRGQIDLIDFQSWSDCDYKWLLYYQDNDTKFVSLRPLKSKNANEVAIELLKIFLSFGAPNILQSDNSHEFIAKVVEDLTAMWPNCKIIHESLKQPQAQESIEQRNQDIEKMLRLWMTDNKSVNWSVGCFYIQYQINVAFQDKIGKSPYKALFGSDPKAAPFDYFISPLLLEDMKTEDPLQIILESERGFSENVLDKNYDKEPDSSHSYTYDDVQTSKHGLKIELEKTNTRSIRRFKTELQEDNDILSKCSDELVDEPVQLEHLNTNDTANQNLNKNLKITSNQSKTTNDEHCTDKDLVLKSDEPPQKAIDVNNIQSNFTCVVCHCTTIDAHNMCNSCNNAVHDVCGISKEDEDSRVLCLILQSEQEIRFQRVEARKRLKRAAETLYDNTKEKNKKDHMPFDTNNVKRKMVDYGNGVYGIEPKSGGIKKRYAKHEVQVATDDAEDEILDIPTSSNEAVNNQFIFQGLQKCICKPAKNQCRTNRCACFKKKVLCGSKCHSNLSCVNKTT